ncbi:nucleotidyl transferase AbiEii/AbiGii toxin family protein [Streptomyces sp. I05A-00742]|uniref:nucleotidyl transferase AbiEii/AbiGii toxin family protein n=1 Tax=Streptomyces sp. I05A-00742 TaxID=2732853 RepID=UPI001487E489|nr:nucleotidyl transferase AbiEii/AbiGii toxin family protein [Streptomyces sp. I05A-00742]
MPLTPSSRAEAARLSGTQRRLLADLSDVGAGYPLVLAGGHAVQLHGLVDRASRDLDLATDAQAPMAEVMAGVRAGLEARGWRVRDAVTEPLAARFTAGDPMTGDDCEVTIAKETLWRPPVRTGHGLVLAVEDLVGTKVRALADRGLARDLIDVHAAADRWSRAELEELGRRHAPETFDPADLKARLEGTDWLGEADFAACGLDEAATAAVRRWAQLWADDIGERLAEEAPYEDDTGPGD